MKYQIKLPMRYVPKPLSMRDKEKQINELSKSKRLYRKNQFYTRKKVLSYKHKPSAHIVNARKIYHINNITPTPQLAQATGCSLSALNKIVNKGAGAYYSSGSRPNQTAMSWGLARLASSITAGKSAAIDYHILNEGCDHTKRAFRLANKAVRKYGTGHSKTKKYKFKLKGW
jgi:hypothetical protein